jgi:hypothetical protein
MSPPRRVWILWRQRFLRRELLAIVGGDEATVLAMLPPADRDWRISYCWESEPAPDLPDATAP